MNLRPTLSVLAISALAVLSALSAEAGLPLDCYQSLPGYQIQMFHDQEAQMHSWNQVYQQAPSGSAREREADIKRRAHAQAALDTIQAPGALTQYPHVEIDAFVNETSAKYQQAQSGSFIESTYLSARNLSFEAYRQKGIENLNCQTMTLDATLSAALTYNQIYQQAQSGSRREAIALELRNTAYSLADVRVEQELNYFGLDFRALEARAVTYNQGYQQAQSGSRVEQFYLRARNLAYEAASRTVLSAIPQLQTYDLANMDREYHGRYQQAQSGSRAESYALTVRNAVRNELSRRGGVGPVPPIPVPQPGYCPDPNTHFEPSLGRCVSNVTPAPVSRCPDPNTIFDERLNRCVSRF